MVIELVELAVDPTAAKRSLDRFGLGDGSRGRPKLGELEPKALRSFDSAAM